MRRCTQVIPASCVSLKLILTVVLQNIDEVLDGCKGIHKNTQHGLASCFKVRNIEPLIQNFNLSQRIQYLIHIHGGILNLVLDTSSSNTVSSLPSPCSGHFVFFPYRKKRKLNLYRICLSVAPL